MNFLLKLSVGVLFLTQVILAEPIAKDEYGNQCTKDETDLVSCLDHKGNVSSVFNFKSTGSTTDCQLLEDLMICENIVYKIDRMELK